MSTVLRSIALYVATPEDANGRFDIGRRRANLNIDLQKRLEAQHG